MPARELNLLVRDANYLLVLLPIANFSFVYTENGSIFTLILTLISCLACAVFLNLTLGIPDPSDDSDSEKLSRPVTVLYFSSIIAWTGLWSYSIYKLYTYSGGSNTYADILLILSLGWAILLLTHFGLGWKIDNYSNDMFEFSD